MKKITAFVLSLVMVLSLLPVTVMALQQEAVLIGTPEELVAYASSGDKTATVKLTADIDMSSKTDWSGISGFSGTFDGDGYVISNLTGTMGLFADSSGTVKNVYLKDVTINGGGNNGAVVGLNYGRVIGCVSTGRVDAGNYDWSEGGIVGYNAGGTIEGCVSFCSATGGTAGGLVGSNVGNGNMKYCYYGGTNSGLEGDNIYGKYSSVDVYYKSGNSYMRYNDDSSCTAANVIAAVNGRLNEENHFSLAVVNNEIQVVRKYTVTVTAGSNGTATVAEAIVAEGETVTITAAPASGYEVETIKAYKTGDETSSVTVTDGKFIMPAHAVTVAVTFKASTYSVTLDAKSGTIAAGKDVTSYTYGVGATLPAATDMTKAGYTFAGWYANSDFSGSAVTEISATDTGDKTFYAKWTEKITDSVVDKPTTDNEDSLTADAKVEGFDAVAEAMRNKHTDASSVVVKLTMSDQVMVTGEPETAELEKVQQEQKAIQKKAVGKKLVFFDLSVTKIIDNGTPETVTETETLLEICIPYDSTKMRNIVAYRYHDNAVEVLKAVGKDSTTEGYWVGDDGYVHIYTQKFSTYAIGYNTPSYGYYVSDNTTVKEETKVESAPTFDAGIGLYVGMSVMAATGSAVVIGKKREN